MIGRDRVTLKAPTIVDLPGGGHRKDFADLATVRMTVEPLEGFEAIQAMQAGMQRSYRLTGWYRTDVTGATRAVWHARDGDHTLNIRSVIDLRARRKKIQILADEVVTT